ncbi:hypothetical protein B0H13DRAFT_2338680 [Mycena leptocephala]|nr:hypothetical protein B0H13DRAFT_2338680 [Mycena leptocephala]
MAFLKVSLVLLSFVISVSTQSEEVFETPKPLWTAFHHAIRRVAVVGAGPAGLQAAAKLIEHSFTVRLFELQGETSFTVKRLLLGSRIRDSYAEGPGYIARNCPTWEEKDQDNEFYEEHPDYEGEEGKYEEDW